MAIRKLCVVTWRCSPNYGTALQAFALEHKLQQMGFEVCILSSIPRKFVWRKILISKLERIGVMPWLRGIKRICFCRKGGGGLASVRQQKLESWVNRVHNGVSIVSHGDLRRLIRKTDCFVSGSDQIWNSYACFNPTMFLDFAGDKRRIAYASSIGTDTINPRYAECIKEWLSKYSAIGVREQAAVRALRDLLRRDDIVQVLDPTFLLDEAEWTRLSEDSRIAGVTGPFVLCYMIGRSARYPEQVTELVGRIGPGRQVIVVSSMENPDFAVAGARVIRDADPFEFVWLIRHAELVCTDSFHATALAVNFGRPLVEFLRFQDGDVNSQNSRIHELLHDYGLSERLYPAHAAGDLLACDYALAHERLANERRRSIAYLEAALDVNF